jgi:hypothetical protein
MTSKFNLFAYFTTTKERVGERQRLKSESKRISHLRLP